LITSVLPKLFSYEAIGTENLRKIPSNNAVILAGNHRSHLDALILGTSILPPKGNRKFFATITPGQVYEEVPVFRIMRYLGAFPIDKKNPQLSLDYFYEQLKANIDILIFPQGGRMPRTPIEDYQKFTQEGRSGVGRLVLRMNGKIPVFPFYLHGTAEALQPGSFLPKFNSYLSATIGEPMDFTRYYREKGWDPESKEFFDAARDITNEVMAEIQKLCYKTEAGLFTYMEKKFNKPLSQIELTENQSKKIRKKIRKWSKHNPKEILEIVNASNKLN
jgi:1-acyl-sn-glycerol-3-phosphate acyltransferase